MPHHLLTLNAGSSSIKYALFARHDDLSTPVLTGQVEGIGVAGGPATHEDALATVLARIGNAHVAAVGHRIVHGGTGFDRPVLIDDGVLAQIDALAPLAPLHQPHNAAGVRAARAAFAGVPQVACFDTAFHRAQPALNQRFALPRALHEAGVRRYGFHGLSYESIAGQLAATGLPTGARVVVAHLGNGASMCAMRDGASVATTMSFSPLDGLPMGTRCGRLDAAVVLHLLSQGRTADDIARLLYRESGLLGLSGLSSDMRTLLASDSAHAREAVDYFIEHLARELAGMAAALRGIDLLVFTGGIGENSAVVRERLVAATGWMGLGAEGAGAVQVRVLRTNEESVIARHTAALA
ncbi:acetate/propionate family kinase [Ideonella sp. A 288]|uniref:acetate/propionate family kinase n=1 Tax=Ideonella sp. A 288 TaxID=1962181 RepID=UPI000B4BAC20|nr:acetate/propionate family kinase [Ideonella sp. A 288]